ncbi:MAG: ribose-phosphate pyrophosphokinae [Actinobacteria bacterium]|jgi:ribose-phosphate pyrophosphokinase|nr:ribose-phosphate pyrophosphokinae [Actinomycetota bacterium]
MEIGIKKRASIYSGTSNLPLAQEIADHLGMALGEVTISRFASGEIYVRFHESARGTDAFVIQTHSAPVNDMIMEQLLMIDALKRASAKRINAVIPFFGYARQDRKSLAREPISARLIADLLQVAGADRVLSVDLHSGQIQGFFDIPVDHLTALPILAEYVEEHHRDNIVVVAPDAGRVRVAEKYSLHLDAPLALMRKRRMQEGKGAAAAEVLDVVGDVAGKRCLVVDDMIDTGGTLISAVKHLIRQGASEVLAAATHAVFSGDAIQRIADSALSEVIVTNSMPLPSPLPDKIKVVSIAPIVASTIAAVFQDESVSEIFQGENQEAIPPEIRKRGPKRKKKDHEAPAPSI